MRSIFTRQTNNEKELINTDSNMVTENTTQNDSVDTCYLPLYVIESNLNNKSYFKVAKCKLDDSLTFTGELFEVEASDGEVGCLYNDLKLSDVVGETGIKHSIKNLHSVITQHNVVGLENFAKIKSNYVQVINSYFNEEKKKLSNDELFDFNIELNSAIESNDLHTIFALKDKYVEYTKDKPYGRIEYVPVFFVLNDDFQISTVSFKCYKNERDELVFLKEYILTRNFERDKIGNVFKDENLNDISNSYGIVKRLKNINEIYEMVRDKDFKIKLKDKYYLADSELKKSLYFVAQSWLSKDADFVNSADSDNAKLLIAQVTTLKPENLINNIFKLKENINYDKDYETGLKKERVKKRTATKSISKFDLRGVSGSDIQIVD